MGLERVIAFESDCFLSVDHGLLKVRREGIKDAIVKDVCELAIRAGLGEDVRAPAVKLAQRIRREKWLHLWDLRGLEEALVAIKLGSFRQTSSGQQIFEPSFELF